MWADFPRVRVWLMGCRCSTLPAWSTVGTFKLCRHNFGQNFGHACGFHNQRSDVDIPSELP